MQQGLLWLVCIFRTRANQSIIAVCTCNRHWDRLEGIYSCGKVLKEPVRFDARSSATLSHDGWARNEISAANNVCARSPSFFHLINRGENWRCLAERTGVYMTSFLLFRATTEKRSNLSFASGERESREPRAKSSALWLPTYFKEATERAESSGRVSISGRRDGNNQERCRSLQQATQQII